VHVLAVDAALIAKGFRHETLSIPVQHGALAEEL